MHLGVLVNNRRATCAETCSRQAMHLNQLETVTAALEAAAAPPPCSKGCLCHGCFHVATWQDKPVDCKLVHQCNQLKDALDCKKRGAM